MALPALALTLYGLAVTIRPQWWLILLPTLWPIADLTPWTGHIHFTESDALVLATLAGTGLHAALARSTGAPAQRPLRPTLAGVGVFALLFASYAISTLTVMPPDSWGQIGPAMLAGYGTPLNAVRVSKGFFAALALIPCLHLAACSLGARALPWLGAGMAGGLLTVSLAAIWERAAFPGLSNFAADYRTTGLFWEMNVGGAALDGWFALTLPFALLMLLRERRPLQTGLLAALVVLAGYATFTTFSRGLYGGVALGGLILVPAMLAAPSGPAAASSPGQRPRLFTGLMLWLALAAGATLSFSSGGYRGMAAWLGFAVLLGIGGDLLRRASFGALLVAAGLAAGAAALAGLAAMLPKGVYLAYAALWLTAAALLWLGRGKKQGVNADVLTLAAVLGCGGAAISVAGFWSETGDISGAAGAFALTLAAGLIHRHAAAPLWSTHNTDLIRQAVLLGAACLVAVAGASYYLGARFSTVDRDMAGRLEHWRTGAELVQGAAEKLIGIGAGRYPDAYFWNTPHAAFPGTMEWRDGSGDGENGAPFLRLGGPRHIRGFGELFRVSQRVPLDAKSPFRIEMRVRAEQGLRVHVEVCRRNLLYPEGCAAAQGAVAGSPQWQTLRFDTGRTVLEGPGSWYAPRPATLSIANNSMRTLDIAAIRVTDADGRDMLANGDFSAGMDRWFFSSDRHHLPWHAKNMQLHLWVEQGALGLGAVSLALGLALLRLARPRFYRSGPAPALLAALAGFTVTGLFDSLLDVPRLGAFFFLLLWVALGIRPAMPARP